MRWLRRLSRDPEDGFCFGGSSGTSSSEIVALARTGVPSGLNRTYLALTVLRKNLMSARIRLLPHSKPRTGGRGSFFVIEVGVGFVHRTGS